MGSGLLDVVVRGPGWRRGGHSGGVRRSRREEQGRRHEAVWVRALSRCEEGRGIDRRWSERICLLWGALAEKRRAGPISNSPIFSNEVWLNP